MRKITRTIHCDRYSIVKVGDCIFINVYLPCVGSVNRQLVCEEVLAEIDAWCQRYSDCSVIFAGDRNVDLDFADNIASVISNFTENHSLIRCDELFPTEDRPTYVNLALNQQSRIDYILASPGCQINNFSIIDPTINFSDHLPLFAIAVYHTSAPHVKTANKPCPVQNQLRWNQADLISYYFCTGDLLRPLLTRLDDNQFAFKKAWDVPMLYMHVVKLLIILLIQVAP